MDNMKKVGVVLASFALCTTAQAVELETKDGTTFSLGGYVKAEAVYNMPEVGEDTLNSNARQSRLSLKTSKMINDKNVTGVIEGDFYGAGNQTLRLRHAYIKADKFTVGKVWNGQFLATVPLLNEGLDFGNPGYGTIGNGSSNIRPDLVVRYSNNGLNLTAQDPSNTESSMPDLVASYGNKASGLAYNAAVTARSVKTGTTTDTDSDLGIGVSLTGKMALGTAGSLHASLYTGEGMSPYSGFGTDAENGELISQMGYHVGYRHQINPQLRANVRYGDITVDDAAETSQSMMSANLLYKYSPEIDFGIEWRDRENAYQHIEVMAKYSF